MACMSAAMGVDVLHKLAGDAARPFLDNGSKDWCRCRAKHLLKTAGRQVKH